MNNKFPKWIAADFVLTKLINDYFGVYITRNHENPNAVNIAFLREIDIIDCVPLENINTFMSIYYAFVNDIFRKIDLTVVFETYRYKPNNSIAHEAMKQEYVKLIHYYESTENVKLSELFLVEYLGVGQ